MSGLLVLLSFIVVATLVFAWPNIARAGGSTAAAQTRSLTTERAAPIYMKYGDLKGNIVPDPSQQLEFLKITGDGCSKLVVVAMRKAGGDPQSTVGVQMRKAGGEQEVFKTNALPGSKPGSCIYSLKQLPLGTYDIGVQDIHFEPAPSQDKTISLNFSKIELAYKEKNGESKFLFKYHDQFKKWIPVADGGILLKGAHKEVTVDGKSSAGPVLSYSGPTL